MKNNKVLRFTNTSIKGLWFFGLSGSGKTTSANYLKKYIFKNSILLDGDLIRKHVSTDLGYELSDRIIQINRILGMCKICIDSNIFPICSSVYMNKKTINSLNNINIIPIKIERDFNELKNSKIYKNNRDVVGVDLNYEKNLEVTIIKNFHKDQLYKSIENLIEKNRIID